MNRTYYKKIFIWQIIAIIGLNLAYIFVISKKFSYMGFQCELNVKKIILCFIFTILVLFIGFGIKDKFLNSVWNIMFIYLFCGEIIFYQYNPNAKLTMPIIIFFCLIFIYFIAKVKIKFVSNREIKNGNFLVTILSIIMFIPFVIFYYRYIDIKNLLLIDVYKTRALFRTISNKVTGYLNAPLVRIMLPTLIIRNLERKNIIKALVFFLMILFVYLCGALKSVFIGILSVIFFYKGDFELKSIRFLKLISFLCYCGILTSILFNNVFLLDSFVRRVFFVPPYLNNIYVDYFTNNYTYLSHSPLGLGIVNNSFDRPLSMYVGEIVMGFKGLNANVGLFTEGYISFGYLGGLLFSFIVSIFLLYFKMIDFDKKYFGILFVYIYYFNTSFLSTLLLTHGFLFFMIFSYYFMRNDRKSNKNCKTYNFKN